MRQGGDATLQNMRSTPLSVVLAQHLYALVLQKYVDLDSRQDAHATRVEWSLSRPGEARLAHHPNNEHRHSRKGGLGRRGSPVAGVPQSCPRACSLGARKHRMFLL